MVNHFRKEMKRPIIGIGHSMGGNNLVNLSLMHPRLFTTLIMMDPVIQRIPSREGNFGPAQASTKRRDRWPSRAAAEAGFKRSKFYQTWDPRVLDLWVKFGLRELPTHLYPSATPGSASASSPTADGAAATASATGNTEKEVTLATSKHHEVFSFLRPNFVTEEYPSPSTQPNPITHPDVDPAAAPNSPFYRPEPINTFHKLPNVRPSVYYIFGDQSFLSAPVLKADKLAQTGIGVGGSGGVKKGRVDHVTFEGVGHLIPMEVVGQTADACGSWLAPEIERWRSIEDAERHEWAAVPIEEKGKLSEQYVKTMSGDWVSGVGNQNHVKSSRL